MLGNSKAIALLCHSSCPSHMPMHRSVGSTNFNSTFFNFVFADIMKDYYQSNRLFYQANERFAFTSISSSHSLGFSLRILLKIFYGISLNDLITSFLITSLLYRCDAKLQRLTFCRFNDSAYISYCLSDEGFQALYRYIFRKWDSTIVSLTLESWWIDLLCKSSKKNIANENIKKNIFF